MFMYTISEYPGFFLCEHRAMLIEVQIFGDLQVTHVSPTYRYTKANSAVSILKPFISGFLQQVLWWTFSLVCVEAREHQFDMFNLMNS